MDPDFGTRSIIQIRGKENLSNAQAQNFPLFAGPG